MSFSIKFIIAYLLFLNFLKFCVDLKFIRRGKEIVEWYTFLQNLVSIYFRAYPLLFKHNSL